MGSNQKSKELSGKGTPPDSPAASMSPRVTAFLLLIWPALLVVLGYFAWQKWGAARLTQQYGLLKIEQIRLPPPPSYIRTNILGQVFHDAGLHSLSLLNQNATAQIARAFETCPWVRRVDWVRKLSTGEVEVQLTYRVPVAMIPVERSLHPEVSGPAFFAIDAEAVLLPSEDFAPTETMKYLHIAIPNVYPSNRIGSPFGDPRILAAAKIAGYLSAYWQELGVVSVGLIDPHAEIATFVLKRRDSTQVIWGNPPGAEAPDELPAEMKLQRLVASTRELQADGIDLRHAMGNRETLKNY